MDEIEIFYIPHFHKRHATYFIFIKTSSDRGWACEDGEFRELRMLDINYEIQQARLSSYRMDEAEELAADFLLRYESEEF